MAVTSALAIYFILWWLVLFTVLPWGNRSLHEEGMEAEAGHASSAPIKPNLGLKFLVTTVVSAVIFGIGYLIVASGAFSLNDIPFLPDFGGKH